MIAGGLVTEDGTPLAVFRLDREGRIYERLEFGVTLADLIERVTPEAGT
jgi:hypothetical protein